MKCVWQDLRRLVCNGWFLGTVLLTIVALWVGIGPQAIRIMEGIGEDFGWAMEQSLISAASVISLPVFAALPYSGAAWHELESGAARLAVFRCGRRSWRNSKVVVSMFSAVGSQGAAVLMFSMMLGSIPAWDMVLARLILAAFFAWLGGAAAIWCRDGVIGSVIPVMFSFAFSLFGERFWPDLFWLHPKIWLNGQALWVGLLLAGTGLLLYSAALRKGMKEYV